MVQMHSDKFVEEIGRPIRQEEADALALHSARERNIHYNGQPISFAVLLALTLRGRRTFRFPFYTPKWTKHSPNRFFFLRDRMARATWHTLRFGAYQLGGGVLGDVLIVLYAMVVFGKGAAQDPRLKEYRPKMFKMSQKDQVTEKSGDKNPAWAKQTEWTHTEGDESGGSGPTHRMAQQVDDISPMDASATNDHQVHDQQTDKRALLEAIRQYDGKNAEGAPGSQPSASAWDRLRQQGSENSQQTSAGKGETD